MRLLHTSDWHIGRLRNNKSFEEEHKLFFDWLAQFIDNQQVDVLLVAGDVFDNPYPSNAALSLYYRTLYNLSKTCLKQIVIISGNHDSTAVLNAPRDLLKLMHIDVIGGMSENIEDMILEIKEEDHTNLVICAIPFLKERDVRKSVTGGDFEIRRKEISLGIESIYRDAVEFTADFRRKNIPVVATGHLFVNDVKSFTTDEIEILIGGLQQLNLQQLPHEFDYFALGHIHKAMIIGGKENIRYSGSPVRLNFSERKNHNQVVLVDFENKIIEPIDVPIFRDLVKYSGTFDDIKKKLKLYENKFMLPAWAKLEIIEKKQVPYLEEQIIELKETTKNIEIISYSFQFTDIEDHLQSKFSQVSSLKELSPKDIFKTLLQNVDENEQDEMEDTFDELLRSLLYENPL